MAGVAEDLSYETDRCECEDDLPERELGSSFGVDSGHGQGVQAVCDQWLEGRGIWIMLAEGVRQGDELVRHCASLRMSSRLMFWGGWRSCLSWSDYCCC